MSQKEQASAKQASNLVDVGRIMTSYGVKGWVKVQSNTEPEEQLFSYSPWWLKTRHGTKSLKVEDFRPQGKNWVVLLEGLEDRDQAQELATVTIAVERSQLPQLAVGEYYWHQLVGLTVISDYEGQQFRLGKVQRMLETGANDVLVVKGDDASIDQSERLIPYVPDLYVKQIDLDVGEIRVEWDPSF